VSDLPPTPVLTDPSFLPLMLQRAADLMCQCLEDTLGRRPAFCGLYHFEPPADCCDTLLLWVERIDPVQRFPNPYGDALRCNNVVPMASIGVKLYRPCWPVARDNPDNPFLGLASAASIAAADLEMDGIVLACCLMSDLSVDQGSIIKGGLPLAASMGGLVPTKPGGGCASWKLSFKIELPGCCPMLDDGVP